MKQHLVWTAKENLLKKMRAVGRPEPATFRSVAERVNHFATVTDGGLYPSIINFVEWWHVTLTRKVTNPDCELISLYQKFQYKLHQASYMKKKY